MRNLPLTLIVPLFIACLAGPVPSAGAQVVSTFDTDLEGWLIIGDNGATWQSTGGNPGGHMDVNDLATGQLNLASAPVAYLGDWSAMTSSDTLSFDVFLTNVGGTILTPDWIFQIEGPHGRAIGIVSGDAPPQDTWSTYAIAIDSTQWVIESGSWSDLIVNVTSLKLTAEYVNGGEEVRIDNVRLGQAPVPVFDACAYSDFNGTGTDNWSFDGTGSVSNPENGNGNGGGFLRVGDNTSTAGVAFAPSRFLGDWSPLDGNGVVTIDVRVESFSGTNDGSPEFIRLSGPGGSAYVSLDPSEIPTSNREWRTFKFPLEAAAWTIDSGTWPGVMAFVNECRVDTDFFSGGGTISFDNFGRLEDGCPPIDDTVTAYTLEICRTFSLIGVNAVAVNPFDDVLHAAVRGDGGRDGVYTLTGEVPYTKLHTYSNPAGLVFDDDGDGFVSEDFGGNIFRFVGPESSTVWVSGLHSGDDDPFGMVIAPDGFNGPNVSAGDVIVVDRGSGGADEIWAFSPDTPEGELRVTPDPGNVDWFDITATPDGNAWVCDALQSDSLFSLSPDGTLSGLALSMPIGLASSIACDPADNFLYVASRTDQAVYRVDPTTGDVTLVADGFVQLGLAAMDVGNSARRLWVTDRGTHRVYEFCLPAVTAVEGQRAQPPSLSMRAYPNPFNRSGVRLTFSLDTDGDVSVCIYDVTGRLVRTLAAREMPAGTHTVSWDRRSDSGGRVAPGVYFARLRQGMAATVTRLVMVR